MRALFPVVMIASGLFATATQALEARFFPGERVCAYEASAQHGASTIIVHNIAILNDGAEPVALSEVVIELMQGGRVLDQRTFGAEELLRVDENGSTHAGEGARFSDYFACGQTVFAAAPGRVRVSVGDAVERGAQIGAVGSSGNSTEPHLHFHVCNSADPLMCAGIPVQWDRPFSPLPDLPRAPQSGDFMTRIEH